MANKILLILLSSLLFGVSDLTSKNYEEEIGQGIVVVEYWAGWNEANIVTAVEKLKEVQGALQVVQQGLEKKYGKVSVNLNDGSLKAFVDEADKKN